jgi:hypothetical protein
MGTILHLHPIEDFGKRNRCFRHANEQQAPSQAVHRRNPKPLTSAALAGHHLMVLRVASAFVFIDPCPSLGAAVNSSPGYSSEVKAMMLQYKWLEISFSTNLNSKD